MRCKFALILLVSAVLGLARGQDYCYRAEFVTNAAINDDVSGRRAEIEDAVNDILNELGNDTNVGFTTNARNVTLEQIEGNSSMSIYVVSICLTNSSLDQDQLTQNLETFNFTTQIDSEVPVAGDFDECTGNFTTNCAVSPMATCSNNNGSFACACPDTYADRSENNATGQICELPTNFTCSSNTVNVTAYNPYFENLGINHTELYLGDCPGTLDGDEILYFGECNPVVTANNTHVIYMWNLTNVNESASLTIGNYVTIPITCTFESSGNVSVNISSERRDIVFGDNLNNLPGEAYDFTVTAGFDESVSNLLSGPVDTNTRIYFRLGTANTLPSDVRIQCERFSTAAADGSSPSTTLIENGCIVQSTNANRRLIQTVLDRRNGVGSTALVAVDSHFYAQSTVTTARFEVNACVPGGGNNCEYQCSGNSRRRRNVIEYRLKRETVQSGQVQFAFEREPDDGCSLDCGKGGICVYETFDFVARCVCADGYTLDGDENCIAEKETVFDDLDQPIVVYILLGVIGFLTLIALFMIVLFFRRRRRRKNKKTVDPTHVN